MLAKAADAPATEGQDQGQDQDQHPPPSGGGSDSETIRVLAVGDVVGSPGRRACRRILPDLRQELDADLVVINGENSAGGRGLTSRTARELRDAGADVITTGNHVWARPEIDEALTDDDLRILRPLNFPAGLPGQSAWSTRLKGADVTVVSLMGRIFMQPLDDPFRAIDGFLLADGGGSAPRPLVVVDFHAEATSEKLAMGWHLAGRVAAVVGTHTHVPTADARVLPGETGYVTDLGMVGPRDSIIGAAVEPTLRRFLTQRPGRTVVGDGPVTFNAVLIELDAIHGTCRAISRVDRLDMGTTDGRSRSQGRPHA